MSKLRVKKANSNVSDSDLSKDPRFEDIFKKPRFNRYDYPREMENPVIPGEKVIWVFKLISKIEVLADEGAEGKKDALNQVIKIASERNIPYDKIEVDLEEGRQRNRDKK